MKIAFGMIVFNSDFVLREVLESIYPYAEQVLIAEGPVKYWDDKGYTTSTDRTNEILESFPDPYNKIKIVRGPYPEKDDMCNKYIEHMNDDIDYIWHVDADEIYKSEDIEKIIELLETNKYTSVGFRCYSFYGGMDRYITGYEENYEFMRLFKVYPGTTWLTHRPPTVKHLENVKKLPDNHLSFEILDKEHGIRIYHYSYVFPRQVYEKISYYKDAVSKDNCRNNYFEEIYMPWVLGDEESKNNVEKNNNGVHEFINRDSTFTKELEKSHPKVITDNLEQLEFVYHSQLKHYFYKINDMTVPILTRIGNPPWDREDL
nr:glycosyltransferase [Pelagibacterales bacterium]